MNCVSGARLGARILGARALVVAACLGLAGCGGGGGGGYGFLPPVGQGVSAAGDPSPVAASVPGAAPAGLKVSYSPKTYGFTWDSVVGATSYRLLEDADGSGPAPASPVGGPLNAPGYSHTVALHRSLNASYAVQACNDAGCGATSAPVVPDLVKAIGYFKAPNTGADDEFGTAVALSADGKTLAVAAPGESSNAIGIHGDPSDDSAQYSGAVYVYVRTVGAWAQQAYIKASNTEANDAFGYSLALSADGSTLAVGAHLEGSSASGVDGNQAINGANHAGAVYVFAREQDAWTQQAYVKASNTGLGDRFGAAVALSADGHTLAVGANRESSDATGVNGDPSNDNAPSAGAVYVFLRTGAGWAQQAYLKASNTDILDEFGNAVALSADGNTLAVGAHREAGSVTGVNNGQADNTAPEAGAVYIFNRAGSVWTQQAYVKASNSGAGDAFGTSVALSADGRTLAVGAMSEKSSATGIDGNQADDSRSNSGAAYVFAWVGGWVQQAYIKASNADELEFFGSAVALSADGNTLAVGAKTEDSDAIGIGGAQDSNGSDRSGAVYMYARAEGRWTQNAYVKASNTGSGDRFGSAVALSADASVLAVAAPEESSRATGIGGDQENDEMALAGAVYLY